MEKNNSLLISPKCILGFLSILTCLVFNLGGVDSGFTAEQSQAGAFMARVGSFKNADNAEKYIKLLESKGLKTWTKKVMIPDKGKFHRVYISSFNSRESAVKAMQELQREQVVSDFAIEMKNEALQKKDELLPRTNESNSAGYKSRPKEHTGMSRAPLQSSEIVESEHLRKSQEAPFLTKGVKTDVKQGQRAIVMTSQPAKESAERPVKDILTSNLVIFFIINFLVIYLVIIFAAKSLKLYVGQRSESSHRHTPESLTPIS